MLELKNLVFEVPADDGGTKRIIGDLSLTIPDDRFTVITGPNGGGKSTLAKLIMGIEEPTSGQILFNGEDITDKSITERARLGIGYGFQQPARFKGMKVKKLLDIAAGKKLPMLSCNEYLARVGLCSANYLTREVDKNLPNPVRVYAVPSPQVNILKASVYCDEDVMDMAYILTRELDDDFVFAPSGRKWIDVMQRGVSKATGVSQVLDAHGIGAHEMMAFGDSMNDYEILRMAGTSVAMGNARYAVKQIADKVIGTNVDHGVQAELRRVLEGLG